MKKLLLFLTLAILFSSPVKAGQTYLEIESIEASSFLKPNALKKSAPYIEEGANPPLFQHGRDGIEYSPFQTLGFHNHLPEQVYKHETLKFSWVPQKRADKKNEWINTDCLPEWIQYKFRHPFPLTAIYIDTVIFGYDPSRPDPTGKKTVRIMAQDAPDIYAILSSGERLKLKLEKYGESVWGFTYRYGIKLPTVVFSEFLKIEIDYNTGKVAEETNIGIFSVWVNSPYIRNQKIAFTVDFKKYPEAITTEKEIFRLKDDIILDYTIGLMWQDSKDVQEKRFYKKAPDYCGKGNFGAYEKWRIPTGKELFSLYNIIQINAYKEFIHNSPRYYTISSDMVNLHGVDYPLVYGLHDYKPKNFLDFAWSREEDYKFTVRCVRSGKDLATKYENVSINGSVLWSDPSLLTNEKFIYYKRNIPLSRLVSIFIQQNENNLPELKQTLNLPEKPEEIKAEKLTKGEFETTKEFEARKAKEIERVKILNEQAKQNWKNKVAEIQSQK